MPIEAEHMGKNKKARTLLIKVMMLLPDFFGKTTIKRKLLFLMAGLVTITPTILIAMLASAYYYLGIESLFNEKINDALSETVKVAELYLEEHISTIKADITSVARLIGENSSLFHSSNLDSSLDDLWSTVGKLYSISEGMIFTRENIIISKTTYKFSILFEKIPAEVFDVADRGEIAVIGNKYSERVRAVIRLNFPPFEGAYLLISRDVDPKIINHLKSSKGSQEQYQKLLVEILNTQLKLQITFVVLSIVLCCTAIIVAIRLAKKIAKPVNQLVEATAAIRDGIFSVRVQERDGRDEIAVLARAFNQMTEHIEAQTRRLMEVNSIIDERRRFIEAVLKEISSGLLVISPSWNITLCNHAAALLLHKEESALLLNDYRKCIPSIEDLIKKAENEPQTVVSENIVMKFKDTEMPLLVRVGTELSLEQKVVSYIVTIDDMTTLVAAQRVAAWGEVAKRIAHEIKNPLTPINLAAERLLSKFAKQITSDKEMFEKYVNTIIYHVEDIGNIVEGFVSFAKMPPPNIGKVDILKMIEDVIFSHKELARNIEFSLESSVKKCVIYADKTQMSQVMVNLIKNAIESVLTKSKESDFTGKIATHLDISSLDSTVEIKIYDNGVGIPERLLNNIQDPYVTTKPNGTGLGLAVVKRIIEDHHGSLCFGNLEAGAYFKVVLPNPLMTND
jgi:two-component system nitrogen regulation sensor histidine kinase NtrY